MFDNKSNRVPADRSRKTSPWAAGGDAKGDAAVRAEHEGLAQASVTGEAGVAGQPPQPGKSGKAGRR